MEYERRPQFDEIFQAVLHGRLRYYYPFIAHEFGKFAAIFVMSSALYLNKKVEQLSAKR